MGSRWSAPPSKGTNFDLMLYLQPWGGQALQILARFIPRVFPSKPEHRALGNPIKLYPKSTAETGAHDCAAKGIATEINGA